ncbi:MAG: sugar transferase [Bacteroidales bacterium]|nr:sugar transferase [Bacteroidales bacterium]
MSTRKKPRTGLIVLDLIILAGSFIFMASLKPVMVSYLSHRYIIGFAVMLSLWVIFSFYFKKYHITRKERPSFLFRNLIAPNLVTLAGVSFIIYAFNTTFFSRMMVLGTFGVATALEIFFFTIYTYLLVSTEYDAARAFIEKPPTAGDLRKLDATVTHSDIHLNVGTLREAIVEECGELAQRYIEQHVDLNDIKTLITATLTRFNILRQPDNFYETIVNIRRINDIRDLNMFFESVNSKLPRGGKFICCAETSDMRRSRILRKYPPVLNRLAYTGDYIIKRVFPKFKLTSRLYFFLTRGQNRVFTHPEILGRLYACGFEVNEESVVNGLYFFICRRIKEPAFDPNPTYGPFISLRRVGKGGRMIKVYKLRTMYPYAEYLQDYVHQRNNLENGGKFKNDFRVAGTRAFMRKLWLDELPMLINLFRGDLKIIGVRPLSLHYYNLYSKELQEKRIKYRPGLIPPYYADMPETLEEIQASELRYVEAFEKHPLRTQWRYFWKAFYNIVFKKARSA